MNAVLSKIAKGITVCYSEVFPQSNENDDYFHIPYSGKLFLVADSYCMNPDCGCKEVVLHFVQVIPREGRKAADSFMVRFKINGRGYTIHEYGNFTKREIKEIVTLFTSDESTSNFFAERYRQMKEKAKEILNPPVSKNPKGTKELIYSKEGGFKFLRRNLKEKE